MHRLAVLALCCACGHDPPPADPHGAATCDAPWTRNGFTQCELACADSSVALGASGPSCQGKTADGTSIDCSKTFVFDGITGCCASDTPRVLFAECP